MEAYVMHRLSIAGETSQVAFDDGALDLVHIASAGVPRLINLICDRALMIGAQSDARVTTSQMITAAAGSLGLSSADQISDRWWPRLRRWAASFRKQ
jgi:general secretion pathway protein A